MAQILDAANQRIEDMQQKYQRCAGAGAAESFM
jgi:hypothetical protein